MDIKRNITVIVIAALFLIGAITIGQAGTTSKTQNGNSNVERILWEHAGDLEAQIGYEKNIGTAGMLAGKTGDFIIAGGGANFPDKPVAEGGAKKFYPDVYVLKEENGRLEQVNHTKLKYEIGYGSSISTEEGVYYIGGSSDCLLYTSDAADDSIRV